MDFDIDNYWNLGMEKDN